jgi:hypothetical protein
MCLWQKADMPPAECASFAVAQSATAVRNHNFAAKLKISAGEMRAKTGRAALFIWAKSSRCVTNIAIGRR